MEKQIDFRGVNLTPYDDIAPDGQLSVCSNLERHAGSLRPATFRGTEYTISDGNARLVYIHNTASFNHFIFYDKDNGSLSWCSQKEGESMDPISFGSKRLDVNSIHSIGNTLIALTQEGIYYYLFTNENYEELGDFPEISLSFGLKGYGERADPFPLFFEQINVNDILKPFNDNNRRAITDAVMARVNELVEREQKEKGRFMFPFFVRYAFRLFDDTLTHHSAPILMLCPSINPIGYVDFSGNTSLEYYDHATFCVAGASYELDYCISSIDSFNRIKKWNDIIKSVDVFVSQPIFSFTPDGLCTQFEKLDNFPESYTVCKHMNSINSGGKYASPYYQYYDLKSICFNTFLLIAYKHYIKLPYKEDNEINELISDNANFYFLKSIPINDISITRSTIKIDRDYLPNLAFKEKMTDDYDSHNRLIASLGYVYNSRFNVANLKKQLYHGYNTESIFCYNGPGYQNGQTNEMRASPHTCYVYIKENGKEYILENQCDISMNDDRDKGTFLFFYYPNVNAYKVDIYSPFINKILTLELKPHNLLNGAYFFDGFTRKGFVDGERPIPTSNYTVPIPNKIYTSEVGNPFYFPLRGINTVGVGEIVGMAAVTTALSQGQFGAFPLMVFCTDGNYALQVNSEGLYSGVSPMQRDVCVNKDSITLIDGAVVFVSARGVMVADGSIISGISEVLNGVFDDLSFVPGMDLYRYGIPDKAPIDFFRDCMTAYDYAGKRLIFLSKELNDDGVWVLSLEDNTWSQAELSGITSVLNSYPYAYIQMNGGHTIIRLDEAYKYRSEDTYSGILVTRPAKLDSYQPKSLRQLALVGCFSAPQTVGIYGSNDGSTWFYLGKSKAGRILTPGRYFKYYRFSIETALKASENISGIRIEYEVRPDRRFR